MTLDGYIADEHDQLSFLDPFATNKLADYSYQTLLNRTDVLFIGRKTYDIVRASVPLWPYANHHTYVFTSKPGVNATNITFTSKDYKQVLKDVGIDSEKDIWVVGGGKLVHSLIEKDLIDEYHIFIVPLLLGKGVPLFHQVNKTINLKLIKVEYEDQLTMLIYHRK